MTSREPVRDPDGDLVATQERADRAAERADSPELYLGPLKVCDECGYPAREVETGRWICPCDGWGAAA